MRFPGFDGEWETKKFGEMAKFSKGKGISKSDIEENGITECIRYGELYTHYSEVINEIKSKTNVNTSALVLSKKNDIIIPASGETTVDIATASCVLKSGIALGGDLNIIRTENNGVFLSYYLNSKKKMEIANLAQGISVVHLYSSQLASLSLSLPKLDEQSKISSFLALLDERIQTQNKIIEQLETLIKGLCQELILTQTSNVKLKDCVSCYSSSLTETDVSNKNGTFPVYGATGIISFTENYQINEDAVLIIKDGSGVGKVQYGTGKFSLIGTLNYLTAKKEINLRYIFFCLKFFNFGKYKVGSGIPHIYFKDYGEAFIYCPCLEKQDKIEQLLSSIEAKINIEKILLQKYEMQKKHLLQHIFI
ncbi:restriction endonuclease subunit S [Elizabethkingia miricola]|uniref:restriction endonuclease subunit S n=1 Tax=Elizabethkingia miricola TaxID=172045 RepID=UPI003891DC2C